MPVMSVPAQQKPGAKRTGKRITFFNEQNATVKDMSQQPEGTYYVPAGTASEPGPSEAASTVTSNPEGPHMYLNSVIFSPDKGDQSRGHYQQTVPMKWTQQEPSQQQQPSLSQQQRAASWNAVSSWGQNIGNYIGVTDSRTQNAFAKMMHDPASRPADKLLNPAAEAYRDAVQARGMEWDQQETLKPGALNAQQHAAAHPGGSSVLQPFQLAFGQPKQHLPAYYQSFQGNRTTLPNPPVYPPQATAPRPLQHHHMIQQQQHQQQQQQQQQELQIQQPRVPHYYPGVQNAPQPPPLVLHSQDPSASAPPKVQEPVIQDITPEPQQPSGPPAHTQPQTQRRRTRRLSKEGGAPSDNPFLAASPDLAASGPQGSRNGAGDIQAAPTGVIQSTHRKRRVSQEANLETLAQKASEMESLPPHDPHRPWSPADPEGPNGKRPRDESLLPLVIPVSVPVRRQGPSSPDRDEAVLSSSWPPRLSGSQEPGHGDHKLSVIVARRRSLRNSEQNGGTDGEKDDDGRKSKRRPRPEPLFIPPPKASLFIAPPVYSSITPYQSHLRSPVRLADNPLSIPPYTPPPILSPVREGSGLYFATFLSSSQGLPPPATPKSAARSLLRSNSCDITPPVLSAVGDATPVSIEPRINIGSRYQAEVPELRPRSAVELDRHQAELVWAPLVELGGKPDHQKKVDDLMHLACSSVFCGGGTNQELAHHCLHECKGDIMVALSLLMLRSPIFPKPHHLSEYHYSGSDSWTAAERRQFNKGIAAYRKDFFIVQKQVVTKSVAQCVEFYYTYKKHVKMGRSGMLIYGASAPPEGGSSEEVTDHKQGAHRPEPQPEEDSRKWEGSADRKQDVGPSRVAHVPQATQNPGTILVVKGPEDVMTDHTLPRVTHPPPPSSKPRCDGNARRTSPSTGNKGAAGPEGEFPCKKCGRIFFKVKSRSAHMKSHAEQEKKAAALRQKEAEERAKAAALLAARQQNGTRQMGGDSTNEDSSDEEDGEDDDWH
ncbi:mitotic deacetylase-associated SANT domain protein [Brachionichthys hirsutus]|uniref:mitotic deacetylase-associated SANT domain protein n=1 Tax=Brachionichthys hirsutus TaxID=412623 RepID=UPI0036046BAE